jgi:hypothetical protein
VDNCRSLCESGPERASSASALKNLFQRGAGGSASFTPSRRVQSRTLNAFQPRTLNTWQPRTPNFHRTLNTSRYGNRSAW